MIFKEFCVSSVDLGFETPSERMEGVGANIEGVLYDMPSNGGTGQSQGSTSTSNEVMPDNMLIKHQKYISINAN